ncbi:DUF4258 domain-containing protein [Allofranklinella schreckenbergeri]|uniref:DUF4258 domain-containing protein n=1 Tax=Allofranklinella schreckenbergeri TaxID=1076744 RepID=A0A3M6Q912_9BURK|nr:DUF4258 domain-containing protein [Allofranklinella schreckenbergeri]RMW98878.1 DUF4258 domain-containing protein [Allofranklinella schreckenbergeri]
MGEPSIHQIERFIRESAADSQSIAFTQHALARMRQRGVTRIMVMEALRMGCLRIAPEPDLKFPGIKCRMERLVSGVLVGAVVYLEYPLPDLTVVTVIDLGG